jgi:hypothetical protein
VNAFHRQLIITVLLAGFAGFIGVWVGVKRVDATLNQPIRPLRAAVDELSRHGLNGLTNDQKAQINAIDRRYAHTRMELRSQIASANAELSDALAEDMGFGPAVQKSIEDLKSVVGELQRQTVIYVLQLRAVLTPPQRAIFDEKVVAALMTDTR